MEYKTPVVLVTKKVYLKTKHVFSAVKNIKFLAAPVNENQLSKLILNEDPIAVVVGTEKYSGALYTSLRRGSVIVRFGVGCDGIDFEKAKVNGLLVTNTPNVLEATVAEFSVFLAAEILRKIGFSNELMKKDQWAPHMGSDLKGKTWAIIGLGRIGKELSKILSFGFGVKIFGSKRNVYDEENVKNKWGVEKLSSDFAETVRFADIVSIHIPANKDNYHFLDKGKLLLLKKGAILINTGRGSLIDENALYDLLENGHLAGAGLDVFENEPYVPLDPEKDLRRLPNIVLTPHLGSSTYECAERMIDRVIKNIHYYIEGNYESMDIVTA